MGNPTDTARFGDRQGVYLYNNTSTETEIWADRVQTADTETTIPITKAYELGRKGPVGSIIDPHSHRFTIRENLHNSEIDSYLAGKAPATSGSLFDMGDVMGQSIRAALVTRAIGDTNPTGEVIYDGAVVESITYEFVLRGPCTASYVLRGTSGRYYTSGSLVHDTWGTLDDSSAAGVSGRDARIMFTTDSNRTYRLQRFAITVSYPVTDVAELGNRSLAGTIQDVPDITGSFDILHADEQPHDEWFTLTSGYYDFDDSLEPNVWINVYDPSAAEATTVIKAFKLENVRPSTVRPLTASVRGLATTRYTFSVVKEDTEGECGMYVGTSAIT